MFGGKLMDTFMDKLTQKLTAQEMIKANAAADAAELSRLKEQAASYEALFQRMKAANDKNAADMEALIHSAIEKIEEIKVGKADDGELLKILEEMKNSDGEQFEQLTDHVHKENVKVYRNVQASVVEENAKQNEAAEKRFHSVSGKMTALLAISIVALVMSAAGVVLQLLSILHII